LEYNTLANLLSEQIEVSKSHYNGESTQSRQSDQSQRFYT